MFNIYVPHSHEKRWCDCSWVVFILHFFLSARFLIFLYRCLTNSHHYRGICNFPISNRLCQYLSSIVLAIIPNYGSNYIENRIHSQNWEWLLQHSHACRSMLPLLNGKKRNICVKNKINSTWFQLHYKSWKQCFARQQMSAAKSIISAKISMKTIDSLKARIKALFLLMIFSLRLFFVNFLKFLMHSY